MINHSLDVLRNQSYSSFVADRQAKIFTSEIFGLLHIFRVTVFQHQRSGYIFHRRRHGLQYLVRVPSVLCHVSSERLQEVGTG